MPAASSSLTDPAIGQLLTAAQALSGARARLPPVGVYETTTRLGPKFREDIREIAELASDDELLEVSELPEVPVSLEHLRHVDPQTRILVGYRLDVTAAESPRLRHRRALPPDPRITLHLDEVPFPDTPGRFWAALRWDTSGLDTSGRSTAPAL